jgi:UDP-GlcNAc:undecaprenyl-phosphate/decaprenyl-phosphate GlcNAc-1-phosphate transferase
MYDAKYLFFIYTVFLSVMIIFSLVFNTILLKFATNLGIRDQDQTTIRWSNVVKPALGGISFYLGFLIAATCYGIFFDQENIFKNSSALGLIGATALAFIMGLADDAYNTKPLLKFFTQTMCGCILILSGNYIQMFDAEWLNYLFTILWVIGMMNSINMLDNMDSITSIVSIFIIVTCIVILMLNEGFTDHNFMLMLGVLGSLIGFIFHNWNPSKMFMGDTGSQFLGIFLAAISIRYLWNHQTANPLIETYSAQQICLVLATFIIPVSDTTVVVINRLLKKKSPFIGGKDHTTHHMSYLGLSDSQVGFVFIGISLVSLLLIVAAVKFIEIWYFYHTILYLGYCLLVFLTLFVVTKVTKNSIHDA